MHMIDQNSHETMWRVTYLLITILVNRPGDYDRMVREYAELFGITPREMCAAVFARYLSNNFGNRRTVVRTEKPVVERWRYEPIGPYSPGIEPLVNQPYRMVETRKQGN